MGDYCVSSLEVACVTHSQDFGGGPFAGRVACSANQAKIARHARMAAIINRRTDR